MSIRASTAVTLSMATGMLSCVTPGASRLSSMGSAAPSTQVLPPPSGAYSTVAATPAVTLTLPSCTSLPFIITVPSAQRTRSTSGIVSGTTVSAACSTGIAYSNTFSQQAMPLRFIDTSIAIPPAVVSVKLMRRGSCLLLRLVPGTQAHDEPGYECGQFYDYYPHFTTS